MLGVVEKKKRTKVNYRVVVENFNVKVWYVFFKFL